jgi:hypothetical protein
LQVTIGLHHGKVPHDDLISLASVPLRAADEGDPSR